MNVENFYIVATDPHDSALRVNISGPYLTRRAAQADLETAIEQATDLDPCARDYHYEVCKQDCQKPGVIQHMASHGYKTDRRQAASNSH